MARSQPAGRGRGGDGARGGDGKGAPAPTAPRGRRTPAPSPRPAPARRKPEKPGSVTKGVQQGRGSRFLSEVIAELRKVSWPNREQLLQSTGVVLAVVAIVALYLWAIDSVFERFVDSVF